MFDYITGRLKWVAAGVAAMTIGLGSASAQFKVGGLTINPPKIPAPSLPKIPTPSLPTIPTPNLPKLPNVGPSPGWKDVDPWNKNGQLGSVFNPPKPPAPPQLNPPTTKPGQTLGQSVPGKVIYPQPPRPVNNNSNNTTITNNTNNVTVNQAKQTNGLDVAVAGINALGGLLANRPQQQPAPWGTVQPQPSGYGQPSLFGQPRIQPARPLFARP
jgi:hypothetical protein